MRLVVSSNCITAGLTLALHAFVPTADVIAFSYIDLSDERRQHLVSLLRESDVWVSGSTAAFRESIIHEVASPALRVVSIPTMVFDAFHPDQVYAILEGGLPMETVAGPYNSAVALWAMRRGLTAEQALRLFTSEVFEGLGYTRRWPLAVDRLCTDLGEHGFDFREYLLPLKRGGVFMHSSDHPTVAAVAQLARLIARRIGIEEQPLAEPVERYMVDVLQHAGTVWPVYPAVATALGITGSFTWKLFTGQMVRLEDYVFGSFDMYERAGRPQFDCYEIDQPGYDGVLGRALAAVAS